LLKLNPYLLVFLRKATAKEIKTMPKLIYASPKRKRAAKPSE
jgi:hypothetical protein